MTQVELFNNKKELLFTEWFRKDQDEFKSTSGKEIKLEKNGRYTIKIKNHDNFELIITLVSGFKNCTNSSKYLKENHVTELNQKLEDRIHDLYSNVLGFTTKNSDVERRAECKIFVI